MAVQQQLMQQQLQWQQSVVQMFQQQLCAHQQAPATVVGGVDHAFSRQGLPGPTTAAAATAPAGLATDHAALPGAPVGHSQSVAADEHVARQLQQRLAVHHVARVPVHTACQPATQRAAQPAQAAHAQTAGITGDIASSTSQQPGGLPLAAAASSRGLVLRPSPPTDEQRHDLYHSIDSWAVSADYPVGCFGLSGMQRPPVPFLPQRYADDGSGSPALMPAQVLLGASGQPAAFQLSAVNVRLKISPDQLLKLMPNPDSFLQATRACMKSMADEGYLTAVNAPRFQRFFSTWRRLANEFQAKGNFAGFLAANNTAWLRMYQEGLPPDADNGRIDGLLLIPYYTYEQHGKPGSHNGAAAGSKHTRGAAARAANAAAAAATVAEEDASLGVCPVLFETGTCCQVGCPFEHPNPQ